MASKCELPRGDIPTVGFERTPHDKTKSRPIPTPAKTREFRSTSVVVLAQTHFRRGRKMRRGIASILLAALPAIATAQDEHHRRLPGFDGHQIEENVREVFNTPIDAWERQQWVTAFILMLLVMWCCGCCRQGRRRAYYGRTGGGGGGSCLQNVLCCACFYELCCRDCQDLAPFFSPKPAAIDLEAEEVGDYELQGGRMV